MLTDSFGRTIDYLRISLTDRCNLRCAYCMPWDGLQWLPSPNILSTDEILHVMRAAVHLGISKIRLTGGEPLVHPEIIPLVREIAPTRNGPARTFQIPGPLGTVGFISPLGEHFCETCNRLRMTANRKLRACLFKTGDLRPALQESQLLESYIQESVRRKPAGHELWFEDMTVESQRGMSQIGGRT